MNQSPDRQSELASTWIPLSGLTRGQSGWVRCLGGTGGHAPRLSGLGLFEGMHLRVLRAEDPMIVHILGTRVGIARELADGILVQPCPDDCERP